MWLLITFLIASHCFAAEKKEGIGKRTEGKGVLFFKEGRKKNFKAKITFSKSITAKSSLSKKTVFAYLGTQKLSIL